MCLGQFCCFPFSICSTPVLALHDCDVADAEGRVNVLEYGEMWKSSFQCWDSKWGGILLQWPVALEVLLVSVNGSVACVKWKESQLSQLLAIVSSHGQLTEGSFAPLDVFFSFSLSTQRWGLAILKHTEQNWSACNCGCISWQCDEVGMWGLHYRREAHCISSLCFSAPLPSAICQIIN